MDVPGPSLRISAWPNNLSWARCKRFRSTELPCLSETVLFHIDDVLLISDSFADVSTMSYDVDSVL